MWIETIEPENATGPIKQIYDEVLEKRGKISNILKSQSLNPEALKSHLDLYISIMFPKIRTKLKREHRELLAVVVSSLNNCEYCIEHHKHALNFYWKDEERINHIIKELKDPKNDQLVEILIEFAKKLTREPDKVKQNDIDKLRERGFTDRDILDIVLIISYFNFVNRIALGLGVEFNEEEVKGYKY